MKTNEYYIDGVKITEIITEDTDLSTKEQKDNWSSICNTCEYFSNDICNQCGCIVLNIMTYKDSKCPINKW